MIDITVEPLDPLTASQRRNLDEQAERMGAFLNGDHSISGAGYTAFSFIGANYL